MKRRRTVLPVLLAAAAVGLSSCGGSDDAGDTITDIVKTPDKAREVQDQADDRAEEIRRQVDDAAQGYGDG